MTGEFSIALQALSYISKEDTLISSERLAQIIKVNPARVRKVLSRLKQASLVGAKEGASGGYYMIIDPEQITLDMLLVALDIELFMNRKNTLLPEINEAMTVIFDELNSSCHERLKQFTVAEISQIQSTQEEGEEDVKTPA